MIRFRKEHRVVRAQTGDGSCDWSSSDPSIVRVGTKTGVSTTLTGAKPGTATITARKGTFSATCTVTVGEDTAAAITASMAAARRPPRSRA